MKNSFLTLFALTALATLLIACAAPTPTPVAPTATVAPATKAPAAPTAVPATSAPAPAAQATVAPTAVPATAAPSMNWKAYDGTKIRVILNKHPIADVVAKMLPDFEKATGIKANVEVFPEDQYREKVKIELLAGNKDLDVFMTFLAQEGELYQKSGWYVDLKPYLDNPKLTAADYDWPKDHLEATLAGSKINGVQVMIPIDRPLPPIVYYRKDLFQEYNIPTPKTLDDLEQAAKTIYEKSGKKIFGMVNRGKGANATSQFANVLHEFGAAWNDKSGKPTVNTPEAIAAFDWWGRTMRLYGPPGTIGYNWYEVNNDFLQGSVAISLEGALNAGVVEDPKQSKVVGKVGYLPILPGPKGGDAVHHNPPTQLLSGIAISNLSQKKDASWLFVQWMTNKEAGLQYLLTGKQSARKSAWVDQRFLSTTNKEWANAMVLAGEYNYATPCYAPCSIKDVAQARDILGNVIVASILGQDVKAAADKAQAELLALWQKEQGK